MSIAVLTDSAADLPADAVAAHDIRVVPITVRFGDDQHDGDLDGFWRRLAQPGALPETEPPTAHRFVEELVRAAEEGATGAVVICMSSAISGTYTSAVLAAEQVADRLDVKVVDSETVSMAQGFAALAAAEAVADGQDLATAAAAARQAASKSGVIATTGSLDYLERGGRIGGLSAFLGKALSIKPLLTLRNGVLEAAGRVRTRRAAVDAIADHVMGIPQLEEVAVVHGHAPDVAELIEALSVRIDPDRIIDAPLGPVIGTHTGPDTLGVAYRVA